MRWTRFFLNLNFCFSLGISIFKHTTFLQFQIEYYFKRDQLENVKQQVQMDRGLVHTKLKFPASRPIFNVCKQRIWLRVDYIIWSQQILFFFKMFLLGSYKKDLHFKHCNYFHTGSEVFTFCLHICIIDKCIPPKLKWLYANSIINFLTIVFMFEQL